MSRGRKILLGLVIVVFAAVLALALLLPRLLDVERYRPRIEALAKERIGWPVRLGSIGLTLWGGPAVVVGPIEVHDPGGRTRVEVEKVAARADFLPLLRGKLVIRGIDVLRPAIELSRGEDGFALPALATRAGPGPAEAGGEGSGFEVEIEEVRVKGGTLAVRDGKRDLVQLEDVSAVVTPATGRLWGTATLAGDQGRIEWLGALGGDVTLEFRDVRTAALAPVLGPDLLREGGTLSGSVTVTPDLAVRGKLRGEGILLLAGDTPLEQVDAGFELARTGEAVVLRSLSVSSGGFVLRGAGPLVPEMEIGLEAVDVPLADALRLARAAFPLPLAVEPPGIVRLGVTVRRPAGGALSWEAEGRVTAARVRVQDLLPPLEDVEAPFRVTPAGTLRIDPLTARVAGGRFRARVQLSPVAPPGELTVRGRAAGVSLAALAALASPAAAKGISGRADLDVDIALDLSRETLDLAALRGGVTLSGKEWGLPGWNLEESLLSRLGDAAGGKGGLLGSLAGGRALGTEGSAGPAAATTRTVVDSASLELGFGGKRWAIPSFALRAGDLAARGDGFLEPAAGKLKLALTLDVGGRRARELLERWPALRFLSQGDTLRIPLAVEGPLLSPSFRPDLGKALAGGGIEGEAREKIEKKLEKKLRKKLRKKKLKGVLDGLLGGRGD